MYIKLLREVKPASELLNRNWETDDYELDKDDEILGYSRMYSIETIQDKSALYKFKNALGNRQVTVLASFKLNGHAVRAVYKNGVLSGGSTRGRSKKGRNISKHLKAVLPNYVEEWKNIRLLEVRGEMLVSIKNFEHLKGALKTPLSAVTSLIRDSVTDAELKYLDCVCYKIIPCEDSEIQFNSLSEQYASLAKNGFKVPIGKLYGGISSNNLNMAFDAILNEFSTVFDDINNVGYACDGIVVSVDDAETFKSMGVDGNYCLGNFAIKMGRHWECNVYKGVINDIKFVLGKRYITPKALIEPVVTVTGAEVSTVPLYNVGVMTDLHLIPGEDIYFRFGGETGVTLCTADGTMISELYR
jgi:NAD-dependent DNA ligase